MGLKMNFFLGGKRQHASLVPGRTQSRQPLWTVVVVAVGLLLALQPREALSFRSALPTTSTTTRSTPRSTSRRIPLTSMSKSKSSSILMLVPLLPSIVDESSMPLLITASTTTVATTIATGSSMALSDAAAAVANNSNVSDLLKNSDFLVFVAGIFPFMWATYEFWRRIMFGESFGTGTDSIIIGMDDAPSDSRGQRILGRGALVTAYVLFVCAFGTLAVVGYSVATSAPPSSEDLAAAVAASTGESGAPEALLSSSSALPSI